MLGKAEERLDIRFLNHVKIYYLQIMLLYKRKFMRMTGLHNSYKAKDMNKCYSKKLHKIL